MYMNAARNCDHLKRILYLSYDGMTDPLGQSQVIPYLLKLCNRGYRFHLLSVEKKERMVKNGAHIQKILKEAGIDWTTLLFTKNPPLVSKLMDQIKLNRTAKIICKREKIDLLHCRSYVAAAAGLKLKKRFHIPFLFDMRGFWVDERVDSGLWSLKNPLYRLLFRIFKKKEQYYFRESAHIISLTQKGKDELISAYGVPAGKITVIPCCADMGHFDFHSISEEQKNTARSKLGIPVGKRVLSYLGSLGGWYMTDEMLDFFAVMNRQDQNTVFLIITHDNKENILARAKEKGIPDDTIVVQPAGRSEVPLYLSISNWNIFFIKDAYSKKASSPTKQGEVMAMGIPIICNDIGDTGSIILQSRAGWVIPGFSNEVFQKTASTVLGAGLHSPDLIRQAAISYFDLKNGVELYQHVYRKLLS